MSTCHLSPVTCQISTKTKLRQKKLKKYGFFLSLKKIGLSCWASRWRICYQRGLPRPASIINHRMNSFWKILIISSWINCSHPQTTPNTRWQKKIFKRLQIVFSIKHNNPSMFDFIDKTWILIYKSLLLEH